MNKNTFEEKLKLHLYTNKIDITFLSDWYEKTLSSLNEVAEQKSSISHPRHRGDSREQDIISVLEEIFPSNLKLQKGYAINSLNTTSLEQDCLILDSSTAGSFINAGDICHLPIESILGSIEIKSKLTLQEIRKSIVNCVSIKKLAFNGNDYEKEPKQKLAFGIFAFDSHNNLDKLKAIFDELTEDIPFPLRPNLIYVLGKGLLIPGHEAGLSLEYEQMFYKGKYHSLPAMGTDFIKKSEAYPFLWFVASLIDHCIRERKERDLPSYLSYVLHPLCFQQNFERHLKEKDPEQYERILLNKPVQKHIENVNKNS